MVPMAGKTQSMRELFVDTTDNAFDMSRWLNTVTGFVPIVIPITEPAVGYGAGAGVVFLHRPDYQMTAKKRRNDDRIGEVVSPTPPSITGAGGFYTENGSWGAGVGHLHVFRKDKIRYKIGAGGGSINLDFYGKGIFEEKSRRFNLKVFGITNEGVFRVKNSDWWAGLGYSFAQINIEFEKKYNWPNESFNKKETRNGALLPSIAFDNRDNIFTPNRGIRWYAQFGIHDDFLGGTETYQSFNTYFYAFIPIAPGHVSGFRVDSRSVFGDPTFIYKPFLLMRGLPAMKYQDDNATLVEFEQRAKIYRRWSLVAFGGLGKTYTKIDDLVDEDLIYSYGTGFRYFIARKFGTHMGMDFAWGPQDFAIYITFGSAWFRL